MTTPVVVGSRFGRLVVRALLTGARVGTFAACECDCGRKKTSRVSCLQRGQTKSCGCLRREKCSARMRALREQQLSRLDGGTRASLGLPPVGSDVPPIEHFALARREW